MISHPIQRKTLVIAVTLILSILACGGSPTLLEQARNALEGGDTAAALEAYTQAIEAEDTQAADRFAALTERANLYVQEGNPDAALADYEAALQVTDEEGQPVGDRDAIYNEERPFAWLGRGFSYYALGQNEAAAPDLQRVLEFDGIPADITDLIKEILAEIQP